MQTGGRLTKPNKTMNNQNNNKTQGAVGIGYSAVLGGVLVKLMDAAPEPAHSTGVTD
jgi:hypothetical protein